MRRGKGPQLICYCVFSAFLSTKLISFAQAIDASDSKYRYFGHPPPKKAFITIESVSSASPLQISGTLNPPSLYINGKEQKLERSQAPSGNRQGLWIGPRKIPTADQMGRFFTQIDKEDTFKSLDIKLVSADGTLSRKKLPLNRTFLDYEFKRSVVIDEKKEKIYPIGLVGKIPPGSTLFIEGAKVTPLPNNRVRMEFPFEIGRNVIPARMTFKSGGGRVINAQAIVTREDHDPTQPYIAVEPPGDNRSYGRWKLDMHGETIEGKTLPGARLLINGAEVEVDSDDGTFEYDYIPVQAKGELKFELGWKGSPKAIVGKIPYQRVGTSEELDSFMWYVQLSPGYMSYREEANSSDNTVTSAALEVGTLIALIGRSFPLLLGASGSYRLSIGASNRNQDILRLHTYLRKPFPSGNFRFDLDFGAQFWKTMVGGQSFGLESVFNYFLRFGFNFGASDGEPFTVSLGYSPVGKILAIDSLELWLDFSIPLGKGWYLPINFWLSHSPARTIDNSLNDHLLIQFAAGGRVEF